MKVSYYPGCSLHGTAREYDESTQAVSKALGVELCELPDWNCCGASSAHSTNHALARDLAARNLAIAGRQGLDVVVPCAACFGRLKAAESEGAGTSVQVLNLLDFFSERTLAEKIKGQKKRALTGLKLVCYYGCYLVRPPKITGAKHFEYPEEMDRLLTMMGAEVLPWSYKTDCCGGSLVLTRTDIVRKLAGKLLDHARQTGAEAIAVACPLCQANLDTRQEEIARESGRTYDLPVFYFTELIGLALGHPDADRWWAKHFVSPRRLLSAKGLIQVGKR